MVTTVLWERLDVPGHDACRLEEQDDKWELRGTTVFDDHSAPASIEYYVQCDRAWRFRCATVRGWIAHRFWDLEITRSDAGEWKVNNESSDLVHGCLDLDFGFTPSTNLLHLRRENLQVDDAAEIAVAWLDLPEASLLVLPQRYERRTERTYWYESPTTNYSAMLEMGTSGFVAEYPHLWRMRAEATHPSAY